MNTNYIKNKLCPVCKTVTNKQNAIYSCCGVNIYYNHWFNDDSSCIDEYCASINIIHNYDLYSIQNTPYRRNIYFIYKNNDVIYEHNTNTKCQTELVIELYNVLEEIVNNEIFI